jgi:hypothetical protein
MIDDEFASSGRALHAALATDERAAWITSAQQGIGSFISYRTVAIELEGVEFRTFSPPKRTDVGFFHRPESMSDEGLEMLRLAAECPVPKGCRSAADRPKEDG